MAQSTHSTEQQIVNPAIMKEQLVEQLKTQVSDLERFIEFLQLASPGATLLCTGGGKHAVGCTCNCPMHGNAQTGVETYSATVAAARRLAQKKSQAKQNGNDAGARDADDGNQEAIKIIRRVMTLLQMITFAQFGCNRNESQRRFERNTLKKTTKGNHYGDLRARLELAIDHLLELDKEQVANDSDYTSDSADEALQQRAQQAGNERMTNAVRKELSTALRDLIEHGLIGHPNWTNNTNQSLIVSSLFDWGCFSTRSAQIANNNQRAMTAWDLLAKFYELKNGGVYRASPARRLSQSFNLHIVGGVAITAKQTLLMAIDEIIESHTPLKRSADSHFKAFVCHALK